MINDVFVSTFTAFNKRHTTFTKLWLERNAPLVRMTRFWNNFHQVRFWNNLHQVRFCNNLHQIRFWNNLQVRFWNNIHRVRFWNNLHQVRFWNNLYQVTHKIERLERQIISSFGSNNTKGPKQDSQNQLRSPIPEGGEP